MAIEWFYFADDEGKFYCTRNKGKVWVSSEGDDWMELPADFTQLSRFCSDLRDLTPDEKKRIVGPPKEDR